MSDNRMLVNYVPGDECRVAVVCDGRLEEYFAERTSVASHVGNIYVGRVVNVEASIQAAFIDFGLEQNGFLHISDLHPRYFPGGEDQTERVGRKTPRRERPPIQQALKRGQEVVVQVIKEGIGAKGPTLTSYISIPGRYLVMMPDMDRVGVSRRSEDDDQRLKMREVLDQLDLPEGFGFILRTAGLSRTKAELKRDLSYLMRLWKDMERREASGDKPRLLYAESDLLVRTLRDVLSSDVSEVVIDNESALRRAGRFIKIVAPRSGVSLRHYDGACPIFTAFGVEEQLRAALKREAPLPSGGSIVIDETEALIAIDVNSGRMRKHGDAETTAYKTNIEAVAEICRQLRLRDLGGVIILDLIDMRSRPHRRDIEKRLKDELKRDRARWQMLPISDFGIVELTRQRMRGSLRSAHYAPCPTCEGRGLLQRPESVASDAVRNLAGLLHHDVVRRVEFVVSPPVAGVLLSNKRQTLNRLERLTSKRIDVRVSETVDVDRVIYYAYDERGADVDIESLPSPTPPKSLPEWSEKPRPGADWARDPLEEPAEALETIEPEPEPTEPDVIDDAILSADLDAEDLDAEEAAEAATKPEPPAPRRRRRRGRRGRGKEAAATADQPQSPQRDNKQEAASPTTAGSAQTPAAQDQHKKKRRRRRGRRGGGRGQAEPMDGAPVDAPKASGATPLKADAPKSPAPSSAASGDGQASAASAKKKSRRRRRRGGAARAAGEQTHSPDGAASASGGEPASIATADVAGSSASASNGSPRSGKKRRRRRSEKTASSGGANGKAVVSPAGAAQNSAGDGPLSAPGSGRRKKSPARSRKRGSPAKSPGAARSGAKSDSAATGGSAG